MTKGANPAPQETHAAHSHQGPRCNHSHLLLVEGWGRCSVAVGGAGGSVAERAPATMNELGVGGRRRNAPRLRARAAALYQESEEEWAGEPCSSTSTALVQELLENCSTKKPYRHSIITDSPRAPSMPSDKCTEMPPRQHSPCACCPALSSSGDGGAVVFVKSVDRFACTNEGSSSLMWPRARRGMDQRMAEEVVPSAPGVHRCVLGWAL